MYPHERSLVNSLQGRPFALLGVNTDDKLSTAIDAVKENNLNWRSWYDGDSGSIVESFGISSFPTIFLVDHTGVIRYKNLRGEKLEHALELLVAEAEAAGMKGGPPPPPKAEYRVFTSATGTRTAGTFKSYADGVVTLEKKDGTEVKIELEDFSKKDIAYLKDNRYVSDESEDTTSSPAASAESVTETASQSSTTEKSAERELREFVDVTGKYKTQARFVRIEGDAAVLEKADGKEIKVPLAKLSESDRDFVKSQDK